MQITNTLPQVMETFDGVLFSHNPENAHWVKIRLTIYTTEKVQSVEAIK